MQVHFLCALSLTLAFSSGCGSSTSTPTPGPVAPTQKPAAQTFPTQWDRDKQAFLAARRAASAKTWSATVQLLNRIEVGQIEDVDVLTYVDFSIRCAKLADELGIDGGADPDSPESVLRSLNIEKFIAQLIDVATKKGIPEVAKLAGEARQIQKEIPIYIKLDEELTQKYGSQ